MDHEEEKPTFPHAQPRAQHTAPPSPPPYRHTETLPDQPIAGITKMPTIPTVKCDDLQWKTKMSNTTNCDADTDKKEDGLKDVNIREQNSTHSDITYVSENQSSVASEGHPGTKNYYPLKTSSYTLEKEVVSSQKLKQESIIAKMYVTQTSEQKIDSSTIPSIQIVPTDSLESQKYKRDTSFIKNASGAFKEKIDSIAVKGIQKQKDSLSVPSVLVLPSAPFESQDSENEIKIMDSEALERNETSSNACSMEQNVIIRSRTDLLRSEERNLATHDWMDDDELRRRFYSGI